MVTFQTNTSPKAKKKIKFVSHLKVIREYSIESYLLFYKMVETTFSNFQEGFSQISPKLR